jgi:methylmalonyl-CoA/ethylmalonyl-CoA epimerase
VRKGESVVENSGGMSSVDQVAVVVRDLDEAMEHYTNDLGIGPWAVYTFSPDWIKDMTFRGKEQGYTMKLALAQLGPVMYELIEPVQGPSSYEEFLNEHGEGLHHLGYFVEDIDAEISNMEAKGFPLLQSGRGMGTAGDGAYAYFETESALGHIIEAIQMPEEMPDPERTYPEGA